MLTKGTFTAWSFSIEANVSFIIDFDEHRIMPIVSVTEKNKNYLIQGQMYLWEKSKYGERGKEN